MRTRLFQIWQWRRKQFRDHWYHCLGRLGGGVFVNVCWPWPLSKPFQRDRLLLTPPGQGIGDSLLCTPIFRAIKQHNPRCRITFATRYPELCESLPTLDRVVPYSTEIASHAIRLSYDHMTPLLAGNTVPANGRETTLYHGYRHSSPPPRPLITLMAECVGLECSSDQLDCSPPIVSDEFRQLVAALERPLIVLQTRASDWTANKDWLPEYWSELVARLSDGHTVVEVGKTSSLTNTPRINRYQSLVGRTNISELAYLVSQATVFVGPVSGGMHLANAFKIPAVIIYGGYESPTGHNYSQTTAFYSPVACAPCWLTTPCPYGLKCMRAITPQQIHAAVNKLLAAV